MSLFNCINFRSLLKVQYAQLHWLSLYCVDRRGLFLLLDFSGNFPYRHGVLIGQFYWSCALVFLIGLFRSKTGYIFFILFFWHLMKRPLVCRKIFAFSKSTSILIIFICSNDYYIYFESLTVLGDWKRLGEKWPILHTNLFTGAPSWFPMHGKTFRFGKYFESVSPANCNADTWWNKGIAYKSLQRLKSRIIKMVAAKYWSFLQN